MMGKIMGFFGLEEEEVAEEVEYESNKEKFFSRKNKGNNSNIVSLHSQKNVKLILQEPGSYEETQRIADHLREHRAVIVNLQRVNGDIARRIVDFLSGCVYALNGEIKRLGTSIFLCAPENVDVQGEITEALLEQHEKE